MRVFRLDFRSVFKRDESLSLGDEREQIIEECCFAGPGCTTEQNGFMECYGPDENIKSGNGAIPSISASNSCGLGTL